jgi:hypothetical protein
VEVDAPRGLSVATAASLRQRDRSVCAEMPRRLSKISDLRGTAAYPDRPTSSASRVREKQLVELLKMGII